MAMTTLVGSTTRLWPMTREGSKLQSDTTGWTWQAGPAAAGSVNNQFSSAGCETWVLSWVEQDRKTMSGSEVMSRRDN